MQALKWLTGGRTVGRTALILKGQFLDFHLAQKVFEYHVTLTYLFSTEVIFSLCFIDLRENHPIGIL